MKSSPIQNSTVNNLNLNNFYNHIKMCLNKLTIFQEYILTDCWSIKIHSDFEEYSIPYHSHLSYSCYSQTYNSLEHSLLVVLANDTRVKSFMEPLSYKFVNTHAHEISVWIILSRILHESAPRIGGMNGDDQSNLSTPPFKNGVQLEDFCSIIIRIKQEINLYGETVSPK